MNTMPRTVEAFDALVPDEAAAEAILVRIRWPDGVCCPTCGSRDVRRLTTRKLWQCHGPCRAQTSIRSGTVLHRSKVSLRHWLFAAWRCSTLAGASTRSIALELGLRYETTWLMVHKIRAALAERGAWQLEDVFALDTARIPVPKAANGDPPDRPPVLVAFVVDPSPQPADAIRFEVASAPAPLEPSDETLRALARDRHLHPGAQPCAWADGPATRHFVAAAHRRVVVWLTQRFGGVSRRYLNNYLALFGYTENRAHRAPELFERILRRLTHEPWRPRSDLALAAL